jgi:hypothetical protein
VTDKNNDVQDWHVYFIRLCINDMRGMLNSETSDKPFKGKISTLIVDETTKRCYNESGQLHKEDGPAVEYTDGYKCWWLNGEKHREDGPAVEHADGTKEWWLNGKLHRKDGPAIECTDGSKCWYFHGKEINVFE